MMRFGEQTCHLPMLPWPLPTLLCPQTEAFKYHHCPHLPRPEHSQAQTCTRSLMRPMAHKQRTRTSHHFPQGLVGEGSTHSLLGQGRGTKQQGTARNIETEERVCLGKCESHRCQTFQAGGTANILQTRGATWWPRGRIQPQTRYI